MNFTDRLRDSVVLLLEHVPALIGIVTTAFAIIFGATALAFALSFALGNRELAGQVTREWYEGRVSSGS